MKKSNFYIWNTKTDETFDPQELRFYSPSWEIVLDEREYLEQLMSNNPELFRDCIIVDRNF